MPPGDLIVENWIDEAQADEVEYATYWNDPHAERDKPWWVKDGDFARLDRYLDEETGLRPDLELCLRTLGRPLSGQGIDLAAGTLWAARTLLAAGPVERLYCLEFSRHRLLELGPLQLEHDEVELRRVVLVYGSFYALRLPDGALDFALLSQAFHHAEHPDTLLAEMHRVLRPGGVGILVGEHIIRPRDYVLYAAKVTASFAPRRAQERLFGEPVTVRRRLRPQAQDLFPTDPVLGDHAYSDRDYDAMFARHGFAVRRVRRPGSHFQSFVLTR